MGYESIKVEVLGTQELMDKINRVAGFTSSPQFRAILFDAGSAYVALARGSVPTQLFNLQNSIDFEIESFGSPQVTLRIGAGSPAVRYAAYVEFGTKPSIRRPIFAKVMSWLVDSAGKTIQIPVGFKGRSGVPKNAGQIFAHEVHHPGTRPQPFFFQHMPRISGLTVKAIGDALDKILAEQSGGNSKI